MPKIDGRYRKILLATGAACAILFVLAAILSRNIRPDTSFAGEHPLHISEVMSRNLSYANPDGVICDWIEIENTADEAFNISGYHLSDDFTGAKYAFPVGSVIEPGGYIVVWCTPEVQGGYYAPFNLSRQGGENIVLSNSRNFLIDQVLTIPARKNTSSIRAADGSLTVSATPTPGFPNTKEGYAAYLAANGSHSTLRLSEIMVSNTVYADDRGVICDWVEIHNTSGQSADASGYTLSDKEGVAKYTIPEGTSIPGNGYLVIGCSTESGEGYAPFSLQSYGGEAVTLSAPSGSVIDRVTTERTGDDHSLALVDGEWVICSAATPGFENSDAGFRKLTASEGALSEGAVVSEISARNKTGLTDADGETADYVELRNDGSDTVTLLGWYLSDTESEPTRWALPDVKLAPGETVTVFCSGKDRKSGELHTDFRLSAEDVLILTSPAGRTICAVPCESADDQLILRSSDGSYTFG